MRRRKAELKGSSQAAYYTMKAPQGPVSHRECLGGPGWWSLHKVLEGQWGGPSAHSALGSCSLLCQSYQFPFSVSWKVGPWTPCSVSCGGGFQSRPVYCISSDGAGGQEATEESQCAGLPGKPPARQACNLQRCAAWSVEPWGEVRPCLRLGAVSWAWVAAGLALKGLSSAVEGSLGPQRVRRPSWSWWKL